MRSRTFAAFAAGLIVIGWGAAALAQDTAAGAWTAPRTPDGHPDIQGIWTNYDNTPFETPDDADLERLAPLAYWFPGTNDPDRLRAAAARPRQDGQRIGFADGPAAALRNAPRRSMVVDPPSGRVPVRPEAEATRDYNLVNLTDSWLNHTPWERCITRGVPGGIFPGGYGAGYQILQSSDFVVIYYEMIHEARIIPLDRPHLPDDIRQWNGDPRGRWEGDSLVIETINYNDKGTIGTNIATRAIRGLPQTEALHLVERLTPSGPDTIDYEVTIDDPGSFTRTWTVAMPLNRDPTYQIYEYACHEGNYGLVNSLSAGRAEDAAAGR
ncbi:MAG: hypothetical protein F4057_06030 [Acidobacteria bacterium]|nr:hypothetical protein [Acidobacteriota bacterium]